MVGVGLGHHVRMSIEVRLTGEGGATVIIGGGVDPFCDGYNFVDFPVAIVADGLSASAHVRSMEDGDHGLGAFLKELADDWKGDVSERKWTAIQRGLSIDATRDDFGHVTMVFTLREGYYPEVWRASVTVNVNAGEDMSNLAGAVRQMLQP